MSKLPTRAFSQKNLRDLRQSQSGERYQRLFEVYGLPQLNPVASARGSAFVWAQADYWNQTTRASVG